MPMMIEAELSSPTATVQLASFDIQPGEGEIPSLDAYRLDFSLSARYANARISFRDRWPAGRFERLGLTFVIPPGEPVLTRTDGGGRRSSVLCMLRPDAIRHLFGRDLDWSSRLFDASLDVSSAMITSLLMRLGDEARNPGFASEALCDAMATQIAIELGRYYFDVDSLDENGGLPPWRLRLIDERLRDGPSAPSLGELAELCGISVRQLTRAFRACQGRSIGEHVAQRRVEQARELLASDHSVKWIAGLLGFSSSSSFCHAFRKATGQSPQQYRQRRLA